MTAWSKTLSRTTGQVSQAVGRHMLDGSYEVTQDRMPVVAPVSLSGRQELTFPPAGLGQHWADGTGERGNSTWWRLEKSNAKGDLVGKDGPDVGERPKAW